MRLKRISQEIKKGRILVSDGAWGTQLIELGLELGACPEEWCVLHPEAVFAIARRYFEANANIIETNSFGANRYKLSAFNLEERVIEFNKKAAELSRRAVGENCFVMGSIGPTGKILMMGDVTSEKIKQSFVEQAVGLEQGGADAVCIETMLDLEEACLAIEAAKENTSLEIVCSFTFDKTITGEYRTMMGVAVSDIAKKIVAAGADIIGTNCGNGSQQMVEIVKQMRLSCPHVPILVQSNAGMPVLDKDKTIYPESPLEMASRVSSLIEAGANIIGGCCGTTPEHIRAIAKAVQSQMVKIS